jgi:hypothetical protein
MYHAATAAELSDLGRRLRKETAAVLRPGEQMVEDDAVLVADGALSHFTDRAGRGWAWVVLTSQRLRWMRLGDDTAQEVDLEDLGLTDGSERAETLCWTEVNGDAGLVTIWFPAESKARTLLASRLTDGPPVPADEY